MEFSELEELNKVLHFPSIEFDLDSSDSPRCSIVDTEESDFVPYRWETESTIDTINPSQFKSTLTASLNSPAVASDPNSITLSVSFFENPTLDVTVPKNCSGKQFLIRALDVYANSAFNKTRPLSPNAKLQDYSLWLIDESSGLPDFNFPVNLDTYVEVLGADSFFVTEECHCTDSLFEKILGGLLLNTVTIYFQQRVTVISATSELCLWQLLHTLEMKLHESLKVEDYEFSVYVPIGSVADGQECVLDMCLTLKDVGSRALQLSPKHYMDEPAIVPRTQQFHTYNQWNHYQRLVRPSLAKILS